MIPSAGRCPRMTATRLKQLSKTETLCFTWSVFFFRGTCFHSKCGPVNFFYCNSFTSFPFFEPLRLFFLPTKNPWKNLPKTPGMLAVWISGLCGRNGVHDAKYHMVHWCSSATTAQWCGSSGDGWETKTGCKKQKVYRRNWKSLAGFADLTRQLFSETGVYLTTFPLGIYDWKMTLQHVKMCDILLVH